VSNLRLRLVAAVSEMTLTERIISDRHTGVPSQSCAIVVPISLMSIDGGWLSQMPNRLWLDGASTRQPWVGLRQTFLVSPSFLTGPVRIISGCRDIIESA
jgi:hypothetical protein